jgi:N-acetylmuramoyl-L-alanine amidase
MRLHSLRPLALVLLVAPGVAQQAPGVLAAVSNDGLREARLVPDAGLVALGRPGGLVRLGDGHAPRFAADGSLWFERSTDDGHRVLSTAAWVLERDAAAARPARPGERPPEDTPVAPPANFGPLVRVCIDPGHGGPDPGAVGFGYHEADVVLDVALRLRDLLLLDTQDAAGGGAWDVLMTRSTDADVSLAQRVNLANAWGADVFCSIHANSFTSSSANGTETYSWQNGTSAAQLRDRVQARMLDAWGLLDRGVKTANFYVLVNTTMPATLSELGFMTSPIDIQKLSDPAQRQLAARAHLFALQQHYGLAPYEPQPYATFCPGSGLYCPCANGSTDAGGCENSLGTGGALLLASGTASLASDTLVLQATRLPPTASTLFFQGTDRVNGGDGTPFGDGLRCVSGSVLRLATRTASGGAVTLGGPGDARVSVLGAVPVGATRHYQAWYRNSALFCTSATFNLSNGVSVPWQ